MEFDKLYCMEVPVMAHLSVTAHLLSYDSFTSYGPFTSYGFCRNRNCNLPYAGQFIGTVPITSQSMLIEMIYVNKISWIGICNMLKYIHTVIIYLFNGFDQYAKLKLRNQIGTNSYIRCRIFPAMFFFFYSEFGR